MRKVFAYGLVQGTKQTLSSKRGGADVAGQGPAEERNAKHNWVLAQPVPVKALAACVRVCVSM